MILEPEVIEKTYKDFISNKAFPCVGAKAAQAKNQAWCIVAGNMACPAHDRQILDFIYRFTDIYRNAGGNFHSAAIIFTGPCNMTEAIFETLLWQRLQSLSDLDAAQYPYDGRVSPDPASPYFSFSLKEEAFFIIGMHPASSRQSRQFQYPVLVFNPHAQFENLKDSFKYENMKQVIRKRDIAASGSVNPMLNDHGKSSEIVQYSGKNYTAPLKCPLNIKHANK